MTGGRRPLVYVEPGVLRSCRQLLRQPIVLEELVADRIVESHVHRGRMARIALDDGLVAIVQRRPGRLRLRPRASLVTGLERRSQ
jgi:hypothetical protein